MCTSASCTHSQSDVSSHSSFDEELLKPLISIETQDFTPKFKSILDAWFKRYDEDEDGYLNMKELQTFAKTSNEGETVK
jgi:Ca2+-binding EF-hand superfamily protein